MGETFKPTDAAQVADLVQWAAAGGRTLELRGGGTKTGLGRPLRTDHVADLSELAGVSLYEPDELVMTAAAGTPLADIEALLAQHDQQLAFEPGRWGRLYGYGGDEGTIGGVFACNLSGPRRIKAGAARDHLLGFKAVSGRGEAFKAGGRVVKNVTGYDLCKLLAGSHGTLAAITELTFKVMPAPEKTRTALVFGLSDEDAMAVMAEAAGSPHEVSGLAHLPAAVAARSAVDRVAGAGTAVTALRIEGPGPSVTYRCEALRRGAAGRGETDELHSHSSALLWAEVRDGAGLAGARERILWRLSVPPRSGARAVEIIRTAAPTAVPMAVDVWYDWAGGLVWVALDPGDAAEPAVRGAVADTGGHATLVRAPDDMRREVPVFQPQAKAKAALSARIKEGFDPRRILNPGRMYDGV